MNARQLVIAVVQGAEDAVGELKGRTLLQKLAYFASQVFPCSSGHTAHLYGPYSAELREATATLVQWGIVSENAETWEAPSMAVHDYPIVRYTYRLTDKGRDAVSSLGEKEQQLIERYTTVVSAMMRVSTDPHVLSIAAKVHYIRKHFNLPEDDREAIRSAAGHLLWNLSDEQVESGLEVLRLLDDEIARATAGQ